MTNRICAIEIDHPSSVAPTAEIEQERQVAAMQRLFSDGLRFRWVNIGSLANAPLVEKLRLAVRDAGLEDYFTLTGPLDNPYGVVVNGIFFRAEPRLKKDGTPYANSKLERMRADPADRAAAHDTPHFARRFNSGAAGAPRGGLLCPVTRNRSLRRPRCRQSVRPRRFSTY